MMCAGASGLVPRQSGTRGEGEEGKEMSDQVMHGGAGEIRYATAVIWKSEPISTQPFFTA